MELCPCGSTLSYQNCCEEIIKGSKTAQTPEAVMRSRYSAYVMGEIEYIKDSMHPDVREDFDTENVKRWSEQSTWEKLEIISTGEEGENEGHVEFKAYYNTGEEEVVHHEHSIFKKSDKWYFYSGKEINNPVINKNPKVGRNDPCFCGSGKKFKKCCGK